jgi:D-tyrosyl-tRNA(Tyr) deacylase
MPFLQRYGDIILISHELRGYRYFIRQISIMSPYSHRIPIDVSSRTRENSPVMRTVLQRVSRAEVVVGGVSIAKIGKGILALVAVSRGDTAGDLDWTARKIFELRIFSDSEGKMNLSLEDIGGQLLVVSQFTLYGDCRKGRRPSYSDAAPPAEAERMYGEFVDLVRRRMPGVQTGQFQAMMEVSLTNDGPVTLILDSRTKTDAP